MGELEGAVADADGRGEVMVVDSADLGGRFFWREWSSSMVCAFTGGVLSSWQMPSLPSRSSPSLVFLKLML
ncbi:unnamed protein product, partial [Musa textilis]